MGSTRTFNLADLFDEVADAVPDREAVVVGGLRVSYRQLAERVTWLAANNVLRSDGDQSVLYTGGTTGKPKGVIWPHKALFYSAEGRRLRRSHTAFARRQGRLPVGRECGPASSRLIRRG